MNSAETTGISQQLSQSAKMLTADLQHMTSARSVDKNSSGQIKTYKKEEWRVIWVDDSKLKYCNI